jgi:hypothetical protein
MTERWRRAIAGLAAVAVIPMGVTACGGEDPGQNGEQDGGGGQGNGEDDGGY